MPSVIHKTPRKNGDEVENPEGKEMGQRCADAGFET
jgi:hypothetical protein